MNDLIDLVPGWHGQPRTVSPLQGGLTNRNYRVEVLGQSYVLRVGSEGAPLLGIDRGIEAACSRAAAALGVAPEVIAFLPEHSVLVRRFVNGRVLGGPDVRQPDILCRVVESIRRYHHSSPGPGHFSAVTTVRDYQKLAIERGVQLPSEFAPALELLEGRLDEQPKEIPCPCHNDLLAANFVDDARTVQIIDWEYAGMGDRFFDLGNLAANSEFEEAHEASLLEHYFGNVQPAHVRRLRVMRLASDLREAAWGYLQAAISKLDEDYLGYGRKHLDRFLRQAGN